MDKMKPENNDYKISVKTNSVTGSLYAQMAGVVVTDFDITLEFVFINPRDKNEAEVVSRITMPKSAAKALSQVISETIEKHTKTEDKK